jgi:uncharacterized membrane protein YeaQ/YmgE (transglycosylase-associated protein family)
MSLSLLVWFVLGLIAGFCASRIVRRRGQDVFLDLTLGVVGALVGGSLFTLLRSTPAAGLNAYSVLAAMAGAIFILFVNQGLRGAFSDKLM